MKKNEKQNANEEAMRASQVMRRMNQGEIPSDVLGSYTGTDEYDEQPVQDVDDL
ncbi:MAG: hypothetical protein Q4E65_00730 [Clostridia bacterium]|nr:hypothetical protein [Clostridia bacterium]